MLPLTILSAQKLSDLLTKENALEETINALATSSNLALPVITSTEVVLSSAGADIADKNAQLTYPRICLYSTALKNTQIEKFRSLFRDCFGNGGALGKCKFTSRHGSMDSLLCGGYDRYSAPEYR